MPHLVLEWSATREVGQVEIGMDQFEMKPTGREEITLRMIDTATGKITEISADVNKLTQTERKPNWGETHTASEALGKGVGEKISKAEYYRLQAAMESYRSKQLAAQIKIDELRRELADKKKTLAKAPKALPTEDKNLLGNAIESYIEYLLDNDQYKTYEDMKRLYKIVTGRSWLPEDDDDEEDPQVDKPKVEQADDGCWMADVEELRGLDEPQKRAEEWHQTLG